MSDNAADRKRGEDAEIRFEAMLRSVGALVVLSHRPSQWSMIVRANSPFDVGFIGVGGHYYLAEVKEKHPARTGARQGCYGFEEYRLERIKAEAERTKARALYVIFDTDDSEWKIAEFEVLIERGPVTTSADGSYIAGRWEPDVKVLYWPKEMWSTDLRRWIPELGVGGLIACSDTARHFKNWEWKEYMRKRG